MIVLSRDVTFDEFFMVKTSSSQQVESDQTKGMSQRVESDASSPSPNSTVSFGELTIVTQFEHHVQEEDDTDDVIDGPRPEGHVSDSIVAHKPKKIYENLLVFRIGCDLCTFSRGRKR